MSINDIIQATIDAAFTELGVAATYTPLTGPGVSVTVMPDQQTETFAGVGDTDVDAEINHFDLRVSEVADPDEGGTITMDGTVYTIRTIAYQDSRQLIHRLEASK